MKKLFYLLLLLIVQTSFAQNLVSNSGFETYSSLPNGPGQYNLATGWNNCNGGGSPDYFSNLGSGIVQLPNCFIGTVNTNSGDGCMGAALYYNSPQDFREYLSSQLISPLVPGQTYSVSFYVTNGITAGVYGGGGIDQISAAFSMQPLTQFLTGPIPVIPQVTYGTVYYSYTWQLLTMQFIADSAYQYITIGNFLPDALTMYQQFDPCSSYGAYYFFDDLDVQVSNQQPVALFNAPHHICPGTCTDFTNLSLNATSYIWTFAGANPSTSIDANPTNICYNAPGNYSVQLIATNANGSDTLTLNNYITVYPYPPPQGILQSGDTLIANQGAVSYQWYYSGNSIPGATDYFYIASQSGDYNVVATDANGCEVEAAIFDVVAGQFEVSGFKFEVYPNPVEKKMEIGNWKLEADAVISIYNILGQQVFVFPESNIQHLTSVDVSQLSSGLYQLEITSSEKIFRIKFVKQ